MHACGYYDELPIVIDDDWDDDDRNDEPNVNVPTIDDVDIPARDPWDIPTDDVPELPGHINPPTVPLSYR